MTTEEVKKYIANNDVLKIYNSKHWKKIAKSILTVNKYECKYCKAKGKYSKANTVHHEKELRQYPELAFTLSNLSAVCEQCHYEIHHTKKYKWPDEKW